MAKSSLAGADGALTWVVSAARAGALFVGRGRGGRGPGARRAGALSGSRPGPNPACLFSPLLAAAGAQAAGECSPETSGCTPRRGGAR